MFLGCVINFCVRGLVTVLYLGSAKSSPVGSNVVQGRLRVVSAVCTGADTEGLFEALAAAGVDVVVVDTAHGHSRGVIDRVRWVKENFPQVQVIGGNIATAEAALDLVKAGADAVQVGIGPGSIRSEAHTSDIQLLMRTSYAVFSLLTNSNNETV